MFNLTRRRVVRVVSIVVPTVAMAAVGFAVIKATAPPVRPEDFIERPPPNLYERPPLTDEIVLRTPVEAERKRRLIERYVFGHTGLPNRLPVVERGIDDDEFAEGLTNLRRIDALAISMPLGFTSVAYHLIPRRANDSLLIYHNGHSQDLSSGKSTIAYFLERGYALLVFSMPFAGLNKNAETVDTQCGRVTLKEAGPTTIHDTLACVPRPLRYFVEPIAVGLNYTSRLNYRLTAMTGLSGGGWMTMVSAALDPRVQRSYPIAGSRPHYITARTCVGSVPACFGDIEQRIPGLFRIANHLELYTLGSWGRDRKQVAINNVYDPCCFSGTSYREWKPLVRAALSRLGSGSFDAVGDATHDDHLVSAFTLRAIETDLDSAPR